MIHDIICSWCPIGYRNIKSALAEFESQLDVEFRFLPYELNPEMPADGERIDVHLKRRNDWNDEQFLRYREELVETARQAGLNYDFGKRTHYWNTALAHKLLHLILCQCPSFMAYIDLCVHSVDATKRIGKCSTGFVEPVTKSI